MSSNRFNFGRRKTLGIEPKNEEKVLIKIPLESGGFWKKEYFQNDLIGNVINDFKEQNHVDIPKDYFMDWNCKNKSLKMTDKIRTLIAPQIPTIQFNSEMKKKPLEIQEDEIIPNVVGKPFNNPFEIFLFRKSDKTLKIQTYEENIANNLGLNLYNSSSAYCNGNNKLFISGGEEKNNGIIDKLWEIDLENSTFIDEPIIIPPKKDHSMIFIPPSYVFLVGGNNKKTFYYDSEKKEIYEWANLNIERNEPALQRIGNDLYCLDNVNKININQLSFEKTTLNSKNPKWILLYPTFDSILSSKKLPQKFFGVSKDIDNNIIFLGGNMDYYTEGNQLMNYKYNPNTNLIEISKVPYKDFNFKEKTFLTYNKNIDYILPDFNKRHPEVVFYVKNKSKIEKVFYKPNLDLNKKNILRGAKKSLIHSKFDFNMPSIIIPIVSSDINENVNINENLKSKQDTIKYISPYASKEIHEPSFQEYDFNSNYKIKQPPPFKEPEIEANKGDVRLSIEIPNNIIKSTREKGKTEINPDLKEEEKNNEKNDKIKLRLVPRPPIRYNMPLNSNIPLYNNEISIPRFHYSVDDPGNELILTRKGKIYTSYMPREPYKIKPGYEYLNIKNSRMDRDNLILPNYNYSFNYALDRDYKSKFPDTILSARNMKYGGDIEGEIPTPNIHLPQTDNIKFNTINFDEPNFKLKSDINGVNVKGRKINIPSGNMNIKRSYNPDFKMEGIIPGIKSPKVGIKGPIINSKNYKLDGKIEGTGINGPKVNLQSPNIDLKSPNLKIKEPNIDGQKIDLNGPYINLKDPKVNEPDFNLKGRIEGTSIGGPKIDINKPNLEIKGPNIDLKSPKVDIERPNINNPNLNLYGKIPGAEKASPKISLQGSDYKLDGVIEGINANANKIDLPSGDINLKGKKIENPELNINGNIPGIKVNTNKIDIPKSNIKLIGSKINNPDFHISGIIPGMKKSSSGVDIKTSRIIPNYNINANMSEMNLKSSRNFPNYSLNNNIPDVNLKSSKIGFHSPDINLKGSRRIPHYNINGETNISGVIPSVNLKNSKNINLPSGNISVNGPKLDGSGYKLEGIIPGVKMNSPNLNIKGSKIKGPDFNMNDNISGIKLNAPKVNLNNPNINIKSQDYNLNGEIPGMKLDTPKVEFKGPNIGIKEPDINIKNEFPGMKLNSPKIDVNSPNLDINRPKINSPDFNMEGVIPGLKLKSPKIDVKTPNLNVNGPDFNMKGIIPAMKLNNPNFDVNAPNLEINRPKINGPDFNMKGEMPGMKLNAPNLDIKGAKIEGQEYNLKGEIPGMKINAPKVDIKSPNIDVKGKDYNLSGTIQGIKVNAPKMDIPSRNINLNGPNIKGPNINGPDIKISGNLPEANLNQQKINLNGPKVNFNCEKEKIFKKDGIIPGSKSYKPKYNINGPNFNIKSPDINKPNLDINGKLNSPNIGVPSPDINLKGSFEIPNYELKGEIPGINVNGPKVDLNSPNLDIKGPKIDGSEYKLNGEIPGIKLNVPKVDIKSPNADIKGSDYKLTGNIQGINANTPKINMPTRNMNLKSPNIEYINKKGSSNYCIEGIIKGYKIKDPNLEVPSLNINIKGSHNQNLNASAIFGDSPSKRNFHGNLNDPNYIDNLDIKGSRRPIFSSQIGDLDFSRKIKKRDLIISGNRVINEQDVVLQDPYNINPQLLFQSKRKQMPNKSINLVVSHLAIQPEENYINTKIKAPESNINIQTPKIELEQKNINIDNNLDIKGKDIDANINKNNENLGNVDLKLDSNINNLGNLKIDMDNEEKDLPSKSIEKPKLEGNIKLTKKDPTPLRFKAIEEQNDKNFGINLKVDLCNNSNENNSGSEDNKEINLKAEPSKKGNILKKGKGLPKVGIKMNNFQTSKVDVGGKLNTDNIDVNNMKSVNVGINGVKLGERIIE